MLTVGPHLLQNSKASSFILPAALKKISAINHRKTHLKRINNLDACGHSLSWFYPFLVPFPMLSHHSHDHHFIYPSFHMQPSSTFGSHKGGLCVFFKLVACTRQDPLYLPIAVLLIIKHDPNFYRISLSFVCLFVVCLCEGIPG